MYQNQEPCLNSNMQKRFMMRVGVARKPRLCSRHSSENMLQQWRAVSDTLFDLTGLGIELQTFGSRGGSSNCSTSLMTSCILGKSRFTVTLTGGIVVKPHFPSQYRAY